MGFKRDLQYFSFSTSKSGILREAGQHSYIETYDKTKLPKSANSRANPGKPSAPRVIGMRDPGVKAAALAVTAVTPRSARAPPRGSARPQESRSLKQNTRAPVLTEGYAETALREETTPQLPKRGVLLGPPGTTSCANSAQGHGLAGLRGKHLSERAPGGAETRPATASSSSRTLPPRA